MHPRRIVIVGGGAAGFFAALACADAGWPGEIVILEKGPQFLAKVRISGGGRCNVTHACFEIAGFATRYPRGARELLGPLHRFQAGDTVAWFAARGVPLKTESDGRMFPTTDSSQTIIDCLLKAARSAGVNMMLNCAVNRITRSTSGGFELALSSERHSPTRGDSRDALDRQSSETDRAHRVGVMHCDKLLLATGGCRTPALGQFALSLGHSLVPPVPSLFTLVIEAPWLRELAGISVEPVEVSVPGTGLRERGPVLVTHRGLSGPAILRLSAWGARALHAHEYLFPLRVNWLPNLNEETLAQVLQARRQAQAARLLVNAPLPPLPARLWEKLVLAAGLAPDLRVAALSRPGQHALVQQLLRTELPVTGKSLNKEEFVTCGGVPLAEVNLKTMESRICPGLFFAGEVLDIDGLTGGFNFQAAWTTGWIAGRTMAP